MSVREAFDYLNHSEISVEFTFDAGHRIVGHKGKCAQLHGHTYKVHIMISGPTQDPGFVVDFGDLKDLVKGRWDHKMILWMNDPLWGPPDKPVQREQLLGINGCVAELYNPTAENMSKHLAQKITKKWPHIEAVMVELWETPTSMARYVI